jgi:hypothetical protein
MLTYGYCQTLGTAHRSFIAEEFNSKIDDFFKNPYRKVEGAARIF